MNPQNQPLTTNNPLKAMQNGEQEIFEVKRHPFGILAMFFSVGTGLLLLAIILFAVLPALVPSSHDAIIRYGALPFLIILVITLFFVAIANVVYWGNRWILTSDSLTQVSQYSLFNKQSSQLSLANLEDVTAQTNGILAKMFNFGVLKVETAGERSKFTFIYCPDPEKYAQQILDAREKFEQGQHYEEERPAQSAAPSTTPPAPSAPVAPIAPVIPPPAPSV